MLGFHGENAILEATWGRPVGDKAQNEIFMTGGGYRLLASGQTFGGLVLG